MDNNVEVIVYLSGKISNGKDERAGAKTLDKFNEAEKHLKSRGYKVINPINLHDQAHDKLWVEYLRDDIAELIKHVANKGELLTIAVFSDWEESKGAVMELVISSGLGAVILDYDTFFPIVDFKERLKMAYLKHYA